MASEGGIDDLTLDEDEADQIVEDTLELEIIAENQEAIAMNEYGALYDKSLFAEELG